jgi:O-antigen ligase
LRTAVDAAQLRRNGETEPSSLIAFALFILVTAVLLVRPAEILPDLQGIELYFYTIAVCCLFAGGDVLRSLIGRPIETQPVTLCLLALLIAVLLPHLVTANIGEAWRTGFHFFKNVVYFVLLLSLLNTWGRMQAFVRWLPAIAAVVMVLALLDFHGIVRLQAMQAVQDSETSAWGEVTYFDRLRFTGIFNDPNEVCVWLAALLPLTLFNLIEDKSLLRRGLWLAMIVLFGYGIFLTKSRGGFLAMLTGLGVPVLVRYGWQRAAIIGALGMPALLLLFAGRQTDISASGGTGQTRVQIWSEWLTRFRDNPLIGEGMAFQDEDPLKLAQMRAAGIGQGHVAHNSFLQAFADVGFVGGCLFLGMVGVALWSVWRVGKHRGMPLDPGSRTLQPFLLGAAAAYSVGMMTLSLWITAPTYVILALAAAYPRLYRSDPPLAPVRLDVGLLGRFVIAGVAFLTAMYLFVRLFVNWG